MQPPARLALGGDLWALGHACGARGAGRSGGACWQRHRRPEAGLAGWRAVSGWDGPAIPQPCPCGSTLVWAGVQGALGCRWSCAAPPKRCSCPAPPASPSVAMPVGACSLLAMAAAPVQENCRGRLWRQRRPKGKLRRERRAATAARAKQEERTKEPGSSLRVLRRQPRAGASRARRRPAPLQQNSRSSLSALFRAPCSVAQGHKEPVDYRCGAAGSVGSSVGTAGQRALSPRERRLS